MKSLPISHEISNKTGIYIILNVINNHFYLGATASGFRKRMREHRNDLNRKQHGSFILQAAWDKYGSNAFVFIPIRIVASRSLYSIEEYFLKTLKPDYNVVLNTSSIVFRKNSDARKGINKGRVFTEEHRRKISQALTGRKLPPKQRENVIAARRFTVHTSETKEKMRKARREWWARKKANAVM